MREKSFSKYFPAELLSRVRNAGIPERLDLHMGGLGGTGTVPTRPLLVPSSDFVLQSVAVPWWCPEDTAGSM